MRDKIKIHKTKICLSNKTSCEAPLEAIGFRSENAFVDHEPTSPALDSAVE